MIDKHETAAWRDQQADAMASVHDSIECQGCGESFPIKHFKEHGQASNDPDKPLLCAACNGFGNTGHKSVKERKENNFELNNWARE